MLASISNGDLDARSVEIGVLMGGFEAERRLKSESAGIKTALVKNASALIQSSPPPSRRCRSVSLPASCNGRERDRDFGAIALRIGGQPYRAGATNKQLDPELGLQPANLMADSGRARCQVARGTAEAH
jgi:hypothetical protein